MLKPESDCLLCGAGVLVTLGWSRRWLVDVTVLVRDDGLTVDTHAHDDWQLRTCHMTQANRMTFVRNVGCEKNIFKKFCYFRVERLCYSLCCLKRYFWLYIYLLTALIIINVRYRCLLSTERQATLTSPLLWNTSSFRRSNHHDWMLTLTYMYTCTSAYEALCCKDI